MKLRLDSGLYSLSDYVATIIPPRSEKERLEDEARSNGETRPFLAKINVSFNSSSNYYSFEIPSLGFSHSHKGERTPKGPVIANIATVLHTTTDYLLNGNDTSDSVDFESEYYKIHRLIARNASQMTPKQRRELINALLESEDK